MFFDVFNVFLWFLMVLDGFGMVWKGFGRVWEGLGRVGRGGEGSVFWGRLRVFFGGYFLYIFFRFCD